MEWEDPAIQHSQNCHRYWRIVASFVTALVLAACVTLPGRPVPAARLTEIKTVAIVTLAISNVNIWDTTPLSLPPYKGAIDVSDVALDQALTQKLASRLSPNFVVKPASYNATELFAGYQQETQLLFGSPCPHVLPDITNVASRLPANAGVDAYIVVYPNCVVQTHMEGTIIHTDAGRWVLNGLYTIAVVDARTHEVLGTRPAGFGLPVDRSVWPVDMRFTDTQKAQVKMYFEQGLEFSIPVVLKNVGLMH